MTVGETDWPRVGGAGMLIRALREADWPQVAALEAATYGDLGLSEGLDGLRGRAGPGTSFVLDAGRVVLGYVLALPYPYGRVPELAPAVLVPARARDLHLHDLAVSTPHRGAGLGGRLARRLLAAAREHGYRRVSLVALAGREDFWARRGFRPDPSISPPAGYGAGASYMSRRP
jgi:predicted N-acetyltransferase YhbS